NKIEVGVLACERKSVAAMGQNRPFGRHHADSLRREPIEDAIQLREHAQIENHLLAERRFQRLLRLRRDDSRFGVREFLRQKRQQALITGEHEQLWPIEGRRLFRTQSEKSDVGVRAVKQHAPFGRTVIRSQARQFALDDRVKNSPARSSWQDNATRKTQTSTTTSK